VLAVSMLPTTVAGHAFWRESDPATKATQRLNFFKGISLVGGLLIAGVDTEGKPGVAWRARHAAKDVRREARHLAHNARAEARLAKAQLT
jgi:putative oxidoreductase